MFSATKKRLLEIEALVDNRRHLTELARITKETIANESPRDEGTLRAGFQSMSASYERVGIGIYRLTLTNKSRFGPASKGAPRGTIKEFLKDFPQFKSRKAKPDSSGRNLSLTTGRFRKVAEFKAFKPQMLGTSAYAWWNLSGKAREKLKQERLHGKYGGTPGRAPYMWVQDKGTPEGAAGAAAAGLTNDSAGHFIERGFKIARQIYILNYLRAFWKKGRR